ncbi:MAG: DUF1295 domain-containing protein [Candidatus Heimdallarchaeota archaeon]|nr:DUF1295 domain-containing protein [Candidatus Heimdallarchaeota archaeon]
MEKTNFKKIIIAMITILIVMGIGVGIAFAGSYNGYLAFASLPLFTFGVILAFSIQWIAFIPAYIFKTEKFYDITGSLTYMTVIILAVVLGPPITIRTGIILALVLLWTTRLGYFLFRRVLRAGEDKRFKEIKQSFLSFLRAWTIQGLWVTFTISAALAAVTIEQPSEYNAYEWIGLIIGIVIWVLGFAFESIADYQKSKFRKVPENKGKFINVGLWSISRHPNYFGEITLWFGMTLIALPTLEAWRFFTLISPIFVFLLIFFVSGVPMLEKYADNKWGGQEDYENYKKNTSVLIPWLRYKK